MAIIEETDAEYKSELKLWENTDGKIWIQISMDENDPYATQGLPITTADARALINELSRIVKNIETPEREGTKLGEGKQLPLSKVNWGGK